MGCGDDADKNPSIYRKKCGILSKMINREKENDKSSRPLSARRLAPGVVLRV